MKQFILIAASAVLMLSAATPTTTEADRAYAALEKQFQAPLPPAAWNEKAPTKEERDAFNKTVGERALAAYNESAEFTKNYPEHPKAAEVKRKGALMLQTANRYGAAPEAAADTSFEGRMKMVNVRAMKKRAEGLPAVLAEAEKATREVQKDFPNEPGIYQMLLSIASAQEGEQGKAALEEVAASKVADAETKARATQMLKKMAMLGKPFDLKFTSVQGKEVDLSKMKGKVVLVDFWATWCGPCIQELPNVLKTYREYNPKGFEIVGISFDENEAKLTNFIAKENMPWAQFFDGKGWKNKFGVEYGINSIPAMWLVDKKGVLRDMNARADLDTKVAKLLAE